MGAFSWGEMWAERAWNFQITFYDEFSTTGFGIDGVGDGVECCPRR